MSDVELNRRQFGKRAASLTAVGSLTALGTGLVSEEASSVHKALGDEHPPAIAEPIPPSPIPVELLLLEVVRQLNPDRNLTHQYLDEIRRDIASELRRAKAIRKVPLQNANEPAALFAAYRGGD
jgi:hypothetical protein